MTRKRAIPQAKERLLVTLAATIHAGRDPSSKCRGGYLNGLLSNIQGTGKSKQGKEQSPQNHLVKSLGEIYSHKP
jgi:hypothetical protein